MAERWFVPLALTLLVLVFAGAFAFALRRAREVFVLRVSGGQVRFVRGRIPPSLLDALRAVLKHSDAQGLVRVERLRGDAVLTTQGRFSAGTQQQLRNVLGTVPLQRILAGKDLRDRS